MTRRDDNEILPGDTVYRVGNGVAIRVAQVAREPNGDITVGGYFRPHDRYGKTTGPRGSFRILEYATEIQPDLFNPDGIDMAAIRGNQQ